MAKNIYVTNNLIINITDKSHRSSTLPDFRSTSLQVSLHKLSSRFLPQPCLHLMHLSRCRCISCLQGSSLNLVKFSSSFRLSAWFLSGFRLPIRQLLVNLPSQRLFVMLSAKQCTISFISLIVHLFPSLVLDVPTVGLQKSNSLFRTIFYVILQYPYL